MRLCHLSVRLLHISEQQSRLTSILVYYKLYDLYSGFTSPKTILAKNAFDTSPDYEHIGRIDTAPPHGQKLDRVMELIEAIADQEDFGETRKLASSTAWRDVARTELVSGFVPVPRKTGAAGTTSKHPLIVYIDKEINTERARKGSRTARCFLLRVRNAHTEPNSTRAEVGSEVFRSFLWTFPSGTSNKRACIRL